MPLTKPRLVETSHEKAARKSQSVLDRESLLTQLRHDSRDLGLVLEILQTRPELLTRDTLTRAISIQVDGYLARLRSLRKLLPLVALVALPLLSGCVAEGVMLYKHLSAATVQYADATAFECAPYSTPNTRGQLEACSRCTNVSRKPQEATLSTVGDNSVPIIPGASVILCQRTAWIMPPSHPSEMPAATRR